jgi:hypothetical protein
MNFHQLKKLLRKEVNNMQFQEPQSKKGVCPICGGPMVVRSTRNTTTTCGRKACASMGRYATRYRGSNSGPMDRPVNMSEKIKLP